uniref:Coenzyme Q-binding protein COQ10 START domain-containing protein n=1 Tax=Lotharella globosa TaxID=91324 RepID=A0A7S3ZC70_9EUKA|mmetsp:Transcript_2696/g.5341  ORF Transcript_2696/g.5341 Transcript_2696/m.5341 type:complete len:356 (-) Transcript_2696:139-1206(-)
MAPQARGSGRGAVTAGLVSFGVVGSFALITIASATPDTRFSLNSAVSAHGRTSSMALECPRSIRWAERPQTRRVHVGSATEPDIRGISCSVPKDSVGKSTTVAVPLHHCQHVITDFVNYPKWTGAVTGATVLEKDDQGRDLVVKYDAGALGVSASYTLQYYYDGEHTLAWESIGGNIKKIVGSYDLTPVNDGATNVAYNLAVDLGFFLPGYLKRSLTKLVISVALGELRKFSESTYQPRKEVPAAVTLTVEQPDKAASSAVDTATTDVLDGTSTEMAPSDEAATADNVAPPQTMSTTQEEIPITTTRAPLPPGLGDRDPEELQPKRIRKRDRVRAWVKRRWRKLFPKKEAEGNRA